MNKNEDEMVVAQINKADEKLAAASALADAEYFDDAISRAYYAMFHGASAVLLTEGVTVESHQALKTMFGLRFIKTGKIERRFGRSLNKLKDDRENGDYDVFTDFTDSDARSAINDAADFLEEMKRYLADHTTVDIDRADSP